ncbi:MAG: right-handed parallel beta-helix repeat-containing protein, partial [Planctomycetota bacterium]
GEFGAEVKWYPTVGNHELEEGGPDMVWLRNYYYSHLAGSVNPGPVNGEEMTYSWDYQNAHFVQLNQYYDGTTDDADIDEFTDALCDWLEADLNRNTKPVVFVIYHTPAYPAGRGGKDSPIGWERLLKLLNDRKVVAGICADTHTYERYQVGGDWETFTWEVDAGNAGRTSHGDLHQTFIDVTVRDDGEVEFFTWQGNENEEYVLTDTWNAFALTAQLVGPGDGATVDSNGAVFSCEPIAGAVGYQLLFGPDPNEMVFVASETSEPPTAIIGTFPFGETWWSFRVAISTGHTVYGIPQRIIAENVSAQVVENMNTSVRYNSLQAALDESVSGEEIVAEAGDWEYFGNIDFKGKNVKLRSANPEDANVVASTVIRGWGRGAVVNFTSGERIGCVLSGFTIRDGNEGIYCQGAMPTITHCRIEGNASAGIKSRYQAGWREAAKVVSCAIVGNEGDGINATGRITPSLTNCIVAGNKRRGSYCGNSSIINCTVTGNGLSGITGSKVEISNCIIRGNLGHQIKDRWSSCTVSYSDVEGGWGGEGNIDADAGFVLPGYWSGLVDPNVFDPNDPNVFWIDGDYHLPGGSPGVDAGDNGALPSDIADLDGDGNTAERVPCDFEGNDRVVDGDNDGNSVVDMGAYEFYWPPMEVAMRLTPQALNPGSEGNWVKAHFVLREGCVVGEVDVSRPAEVWPGGIESEYMNVFVNEDGLVEIEAGFDRGEVCAAGIEGEAVEVTVVGWLRSGQQFYGTERIQVTTNYLKYLRGLAS